MEQNNIHIVKEIPLATTRITDYAIGLFPELRTKNAVKKAIKKDILLIDGKAATTGSIIQKDQKIELLPEKITSKTYEFKLDIVFEDDHIALINKPAGISVSGNTFKTIQNALPFNLKLSTQADALQKLLPVHRLDNQTSGLLLIAKTHSSRIELGRQFENKEVKKKYKALVIGTPDTKGEINIPIEGKVSKSLYTLSEKTRFRKFEDLALLDLEPITGRTHQLRIHCYESGFPILGDKLYYKEDYLLKGKGLFLCASYISFTHPFLQNQLEFEIPMPDKFKKYFKADE